VSNSPQESADFAVARRQHLRSSLSTASVSAVVPRSAFVICPSFHGATLLSLLLNNHSQLSALGDTNPIRAYNSVCACGQNFSTCSFWRTVEARLKLGHFSDLDTLLPVLPPYPWPLSAHRPLEGRADNALIRAAGRSLTQLYDALLRIAWRRGSSEVSEYLRIWESFYTLVAELNETSVVVDGSKTVRKIGLMARQFGASNIRVVHLIRDPRAFINSWRRYHDDSDMRRLSWIWADSHRSIEARCEHVPYLRVRYEDLARRPEQEIEMIFEFLEVGSEPVVGPPRFPEKHHVVGNVNALKFDGSVKLDERWRAELTPKEQADVLRYAGDVARRYDYA
jgi:hypothetical protein